MERSIAAQKRGTETRFPALRGLRSGDTIELLSTSDLWRKRVLFALAALAAVLGSVGADRRCKKGAEDADEPPVVAPKEPV